MIFFIIAFFSRWQMHSWQKAVVFSGSILIAFLFLILAARLLMWLARRFFPTNWNYLWRQGFANLYRPNNQTMILIITIGLGAAFIGTLYSIQNMLIRRVSVLRVPINPICFFLIFSRRRWKPWRPMSKTIRLPVLQRIPHRNDADGGDQWHQRVKGI